MPRSQRPLLCLALAWGASCVSRTHAQDVVPGGWSSHVGFHSFPAPRSTGNAGGADFGSPGVAASLGFPGVPPDGSFAPNLSTQARSQVFQGLVPLSDAVRRGTTRKRPRR